jgi:predicted GNAT family acetyltransferase
MQVEHEMNAQRFVLRRDKGEAELTYARPSDDVLDLQHTFVPPPLRGQGLADALVRHAWEHAREHDLKIKPTCPYVRAWLAKHPQE